MFLLCLDPVGTGAFGRHEGFSSEPHILGRRSCPIPWEAQGLPSGSHFDFSQRGAFRAPELIENDYIDTARSFRTIRRSSSSGTSADLTP